uniref:Conserved secreted protein n=1 Tax=Steinernema glaseri TaxID=37863 RepID=A0A1I8A9X6_9BILA
MASNLMIILLALSALLLCVEVVWARAPPDPCLLKCKDNYMNEMQSILHDSSGEWSIELVTPLQSVLRATSKQSLAGGPRQKEEEADDVVAKVGDICQTNRVYLSCLGQCRESPARNALFIGQKSWTTICNAYGNDPAILPLLDKLLTDRVFGVAR